MQLAFNLSIKFGIIGKTVGIQILPTAWKALTLVKVVIALKVLPSSEVQGQNKKYYFLV